MSLTPDTRALLTDSLHPPSGYRLDQAVGTTYSTNLTALLMIPVSFAFTGGTFGEVGDHTHEQRDPVAVLEAIRRYSDVTTVFCQAGAIHVPTSYPRLLPLIEDSLIEVNLASAGIFHPKIWALRFVDDTGSYRHRLVVLSRNLTFDRSWDTALVLDQTDHGAAGEGSIDAGPAAEFVRWLPSLALREMSPGRREAVRHLAETLDQVAFAPPAEFSAGRLLPLRPDHVSSSDLFPTGVRRLLAISPFLDRTALRTLAGRTRDLTLVSRSETLDELGSSAVADWASYVLQDWTELDDETTTSDGFLESPVGLHAKTFIADLTYQRSVMVTGSANLTSAAWGDGSRPGNNVEFDVVLEGPTWSCGVEATLAGSSESDDPAIRREAPGLRSVLAAYQPATAGAMPDPAQDSSYIIERFHRSLAAAHPTLHIASPVDGVVEATLRVAIPADAVGRSVVWPITKVDPRRLEPAVNWHVAETNVTPYLAIETTFGDGAARTTRRCVVTAELTGAIDLDRRREATFQILTSSSEVLRYLVYLLGDAQYGELLAQLGGPGPSTGSFGAEPLGTDLALLDPLVRALGRNDDALQRIADLMDDLRTRPDGVALVPEGFDELWDLVWSVQREARP